MDLSKILQSLEGNLLTPIPLCFALGIFCKLIHGGIKIPKELYYSISIYLLMSIGFIGGHELALADLKVVFWPALVTLFLGCLTPIVAYTVAHYVGRMSVADSAGIAAHYGSTSAVTFAVALAFVNSQKLAMDGYLPTLVTILECPGIAIALAIGVMFSGGSSVADGEPQEKGKLGEALHEVLTGQSIMLMAGLLVIGYIATVFIPGADAHSAVKHQEHVAHQTESLAKESSTLTTEQKATVEKAAKTAADAEFKASSFAPFFDFFYSKNMIFRGLLCIFLLEMGLVAGERLKDLLKVGPFLLAFGIFIPLFHGFLGAYLGHWAGLSLGGCTVFAAIVSSASYIAAPPAVRLTLPEANPTLSITASLAITFPFNIAIGIPIYYEMAKFVGAQ